MKKALLVLLATGWFLCGFAQEIQFETTVHDFGLVNYNDPAVFDFVFTNTGTEPLIVQKPKMSHNTIPSWPKDPVLPGKKDKISVYYRTNKPGVFDNNVTITSNAKNAPKIILRVKGFVWPQGIKVYQKNDYWSFEYNNGETVPYQQYDQVLGGDGDVQLMKKGKWGVVGRTNVIPCEYDERFGFANSMTVKKGGKWGVIDKENRVVISFEYEELRSCVGRAVAPGSLFAKKNGKWGIIDKEGCVIIPFEYEELNSYVGNGKAFRSIFVKKNGKWGVIDKENSVIIPFEYDDLIPDVQYIVDGLLFAKKNGKWGIIDIENSVFIPFEYDDAKILPGRGIVKKGGKWGIIDIGKDEVIIPFEYEELIPDDTGAGALFAKKNGKWGKIDRSGKIIIIPFKYNELKELKKAYYIR